MNTLAEKKSLSLSLSLFLSRRSHRAVRSRQAAVNLPSSCVDPAASQPGLAVGLRANRQMKNLGPYPLKALGQRHRPIFTGRRSLIKRTNLVSRAHSETCRHVLIKITPGRAGIDGSSVADKIPATPFYFQQELKKFKRSHKADMMNTLEIERGCVKSPVI